jgi:hypothetical protein
MRKGSHLRRTLTRPKDPGPTPLDGAARTLEPFRGAQRPLLRGAELLFGDTATPELVSTRLGCVIDQPEYPGLDLAALCLRNS